MKKPSKKFLKSKKILIILTALFTLFWILPDITINIPLGDNFAQFHWYRGYNLFFPKDDTTFYYLHGFNRPTIITGGSTKLESLLPDPQYPSSQKGINWISIKSRAISLPFKLPSFSFSFPVTPPTSTNIPNLLPKIMETSPTHSKTTVSKILNLTFTTPAGFETHYSTLFDGGMETIEFKKGYRMTIHIFRDLPESDCKDSSNIKTIHPKTLLAGEVELAFPETDRDGRKGWIGATARKYFPQKRACLDVYKEFVYSSPGKEVSASFDQILTTAQFK